MLSTLAFEQNYPKQRRRGSTSNSNSGSDKLHVELSLELIENMQEVYMTRYESEMHKYPNVCMFGQEITVPAYSSGGDRRVACFCTEEDLETHKNGGTLQLKQLKLNEAADELFGMSCLTISAWVFMERTCPGLFDDLAAFTYDFQYNDAQDFRSFVYCTKKAEDAIVTKLCYDTSDFQ